MKYAFPAVLLGAIAASLLTLGRAYGTEGNDYLPRSPSVLPVADPLYIKECGSCHMAYSPGLLPTRSWVAMMGALADHFGDNAELEPTPHKAIVDYLVANSADASDYRRSKKIMRTLDANTTPLRISELPSIKRVHHELPAKVFSTTPELRSLSQCSACHRNAVQGSFSEREINIPGRGRWED